MFGKHSVSELTRRSLIRGSTAGIAGLALSALAHEHTAAADDAAAAGKKNITTP